MAIPTRGLVFDEPTAPSDPGSLIVPAPAVGMFERMASDPSVDVEKLERLVQMYERSERRAAEGQFNAAMSAAQTEMRPVSADADNPQTRSKYASYGKLDRALRPIYTRHGFGLSFNTGEGAPQGWVRVLCEVTHAGGFAKPYHLDMPADGKGAKGGDVMTLTHAVGAAMSYGMRYLLKMIFNVAVGEDDKDGNVPTERPDAPAGYESWWTDMTAAADNGLPVLEAAFQAAKPQHKAYMHKFNRSGWEQLKKRAEAVNP